MKKLLLIGLTFIAHFALSAQGSSYNFIENKGQITSDNSSVEVKYYTQNSNVKMFLTNTGIIYQLEKFTKLNSEKSETDIFNKTEEENFSIETFRTDVTLIGGNPNPIIETYEEQKSYLNFYLPQCPEGALNVKHYKKLVYRNIYEGIDWVWKFTDEGIKYDFVVHPGADYRQIQLKFGNEIKPAIDAEGNLRIENQLGTLVEKAPVSFSEDKIVESRFVLQENILSFFVGDYNPNKTLVIDPTLLWGLYHGGNDYENTSGSGLDSLDNLYITGQTSSNNNIAQGGYQSNRAGSADSYLVKIDNNGKIVWATYFGGSSGDQSSSLAIDHSLNIYIGGGTNSKSNISKNGHQKDLSIGNGLHNRDGFLAKFNSLGVLIWSTYYGGRGSDNINTVTTDNDGYVYFGGRTSSFDLGSIEENGYQNPNLTASPTGFFAKFDSSGTRIWGSYFGGNSTLEVFDIQIDKKKNIFLGGTTSADKGIAFNAFDTIHNGGRDAFVAKFDSSLNKIWCTYYGGFKHDDVNELVIDTFGNVYIAGFTESNNDIFYNGFLASGPITSWKNFLVKFDSSGNRKWGTYYGGVRSGNATITTDDSGNVYMAGMVRANADYTENAFQAIGNGLEEGYVAKFNTNGKRIWGSYFGGNGTDNILSIAINKKTNDIYLTGHTSSTNNISFGTTPTGFNGVVDMFAVRISQKLSTKYEERKVCPNTSILFLDPPPTTLFTTYWFKDSLDITPIKVGDSFSTIALKSDTIWGAFYDGTKFTPRVPKIILVDGVPNANFFVDDSIQCLKSNTFKFFDSTTVSNGNLNYKWLFANSDTSTLKNPVFSFDSVDTYTIKLVTITDIGCADSIEKAVKVVHDPVANFNPGLVSFLLCEEEEFTPVNQSSIQTGSLSYEWDFGTGDTTSQKNPIYLYNTQGNYTIQLKAISDNGCVDSLSKSVKVDPLPTANTILGGGTAQRNTQRSYFILNTTTNSKYSWDVDGGVVNGAPFGDSLQVQWGVGTLGTITLFEETEFGCTDTIAVKNISLLNTSVENVSGTSYSVYPVPANNYLVLNVNAKVTYTLTDVLGKQVANGIALPSVDNRVETSQLSNGVYLLQLHNSNSVVATQRVVVRH